MKLELALVGDVDFASSHTFLQGKNQTKSFGKRSCTILLRA